MERQAPIIDQKYIDMVTRFQAMPKDRKHCIERYKMIMKYKVWFRDHVEQLTKAERAYLQKNIIPVKTYLDDENDALNDTDPNDKD